MKSRNRLVPTGLSLALAAALLQGCYGNFNLTRKLYTWNGTLGDKYINSLVMWVMVILPIYGLAGLADFAVFNLIEFWTGSNPIALKPGEKEIRFVEKDGVRYILTATTNRLDIARADGDARTSSLVFDPASRAWYAETASDRVKVAEWADGEGRIMDLIHPDGTRERLALE
jgi:hypothetical protein